MAIHVGFHITGIMKKISDKMKNGTFEYVYYFVLILLVVFGLYSFISLNLWQDMFLMNHFKFFDYEKSPIIFYLQYIGIAIFIEIITYLVISIAKKL